MQEEFFKNKRVVKMHLYVKLTRLAIEEYIKKNKRMETPSNLPEELSQKRRGVFVTLYKNGRLRGCMGTVVSSKKNLAEEIIDNAILACSRDPRFNFVTKEELKELNCEVSIIHPPERLENLEDHDPRRQGIIVKSFNGRSGLLLPDLEGVDSTKKQIEIAAEKGGINPYSEEVQLFEFEVEKYV
ncbi:MAG: AmmeMemoRadiSam system protein A [Candidatus Moraniibacteriota bacterium]